MASYTVAMWDPPGDLGHDRGSHSRTAAAAPMAAEQLQQQMLQQQMQQEMLHKKLHVGWSNHLSWQFHDVFTVTLW